MIPKTTHTQALSHQLIYRNQDPVPFSDTNSTISTVLILFLTCSLTNKNSRKVGKKIRECVLHIFFLFFAFPRFDFVCSVDPNNKWEMTGNRENHVPKAKKTNLFNIFYNPNHSLYSITLVY